MSYRIWFSNEVLVKNNSIAYTVILGYMYIPVYSILIQRHFVGLNTIQVWFETPTNNADIYSVVCIAQKSNDLHGLACIVLLFNF